MLNLFFKSLSCWVCCEIFAKIAPRSKPEMLFTFCWHSVSCYYRVIHEDHSGIRDDQAIATMVPCRLYLLQNHFLLSTVCSNLVIVPYLSSQDGWWIIIIERSVLWILIISWCWIRRHTTTIGSCSVQRSHGVVDFLWCFVESAIIISIHVIG